MQVLLSEEEYSQLKTREKFYLDMMNKISDCFEVEYANDGDFIRCKEPTLKEAIINMDKVAGLASSKVRKILKENNVTLKYSEGKIIKIENLG